MLKAITAKKIKGIGGRFAIVASRYNARYVAAMLRSATAELKRAGAEKIEIIRVPGAYEISVVAAKLARNPEAPVAASLPGCDSRGQTVHADHIGRAVSHALMEIQPWHEAPVIHEVLLLENEEQAKVRCLDKKFNRGTEAAQTAIEMARVMRGLEV